MLDCCMECARKIESGGWRWRRGRAGSGSRMGFAYHGGCVNMTKRSVVVV